MNLFQHPFVKVYRLNISSFLIFFLYSYLLLMGMLLFYTFDNDLESWLIHRFSFINHSTFEWVSLLFLFFFLFLQSIGNAYVFGCLYGSCSDLFFKKAFSIKEHTTHGLRNILRLTGLQWVPFTLIVIIKIFHNSGLIQLPFSNEMISYICYALVILICYVFQYTPLFLVHFRAKVWQSINWSFRLIKRKFLSTVLAFLLITIPILLIIRLQILFGASLVIFSLALINTYVYKITILLFVIWSVFFFPLIITGFTMFSIRYYHRHLDEALTEAKYNLKQQPFIIK